jgi:hypothetical protein
VQSGDQAREATRDRRVLGDAFEDWLENGDKTPILAGKDIFGQGDVPFEEDDDGAE